LSQVIDERPDGVSALTWSYGTKASFDFVVCDEITWEPLFAVDSTTHLILSKRRNVEIK
jgi:hypothetical protein